MHACRPYTYLINFQMIKVIDLFAGPGGLGEGFSSVLDKSNSKEFKIALSIEKDEAAHKTLLLRSFFRQFNEGDVPEEYYKFLKGELKDIQDLYQQFPLHAEHARHEAWRAELGKNTIEEIDQRINEALNGEDRWVLVGGPPCQAYSQVGRSRVGGIDRNDGRASLYKQYLRIIAEHQPPVFVMENVKGLLSAKFGKRNLIFQKILKDLSDPNSVFPNSNSKEYYIYSLVSRTFKKNGKQLTREQLKDYVIKSERYGIPQRRHRVILLGIRADIKVVPGVLNPSNTLELVDVLQDLPRLRSGISKAEDSSREWISVLKHFQNNGFMERIQKSCNENVFGKINSTLNNLKIPQKGRGGGYVERRKDSKDVELMDWYRDPILNGFCNHESRSHISKDLERYFYAACYAEAMNVSPKLNEYPKFLLPDHKNVDSGKFNDRFRVQLKNKPATTITSHISKDGHYFIHYDPSQCRSLTVREAARIQTFPDNYFFMGNRTEQYHQVGNAVPPILANQIASILSEVFRNFQ